MRQTSGTLVRPDTRGSRAVDPSLRRTFFQRRSFHAGASLHHSGAFVCPVPGSDPKQSLCPSHTQCRKSLCDNVLQQSVEVIYEAEVKNRLLGQSARSQAFSLGPVRPTVQMKDDVPPPPRSHTRPDGTSGIGPPRLDGQSHRLQLGSQYAIARSTSGKRAGRRRRPRWTVSVQPHRVSR